MIQRGPTHRYDGSGEDADLAAWMLSLVDAAPDRLAFIQIPRTTDEHLDALEDKTRRAFDLARRDRPELRVKLLPPFAELLGGHSQDDIALVVVLHEHLWVGGECVRGCGEAPA